MDNNSRLPSNAKADGSSQMATGSNNVASNNRRLPSTANEFNRVMVCPRSQIFSRRKLPISVLKDKADGNYLGYDNRILPSPALTDDNKQRHFRASNIYPSLAPTGTNIVGYDNESLPANRKALLPILDYYIYQDLAGECKCTIIYGLIKQLYNNDILYGAIVYGGFYYILHDMIYYIIANLVGDEDLAMGILWHGKIERFVQDDTNKRYPLAYMLAKTYIDCKAAQQGKEPLREILKSIAKYYHRRQFDIITIMLPQYITF